MFLEPDVCQVCRNKIKVRRKSRNLTPQKKKKRKWAHRKIKEILNIMYQNNLEFAAIRGIRHSIQV